MAAEVAAAAKRSIVEYKSKLILEMKGATMELSVRAIFAVNFLLLATLLIVRV
jgi:hypothetical protein